MIYKNVEVIKFQTKGSSFRIMKQRLHSVRSVDCLSILKDSGPFFGQIRNATIKSGGIDFSHLAFLVTNPYISNWGTAIFADIETLATPAGRYLDDAILESRRKFSDVFQIEPYEIGYDFRIVLLGFLLSQKKRA